jgi:mannitol/fructose-specific phosphotransferase system IIA component (Ntr-type)
MKPISDFISSDAIITELKSSDRDGVLGELANILSNSYPSIPKDHIFTLLRAREELCSTAMDFGMAIPHAKIDQVEQTCGAFARSSAGIEFGSSKEEKTHLFFVLVSPANNASNHLMALAQISRSFQNKGFREKISTIDGKINIYNLLIGK